MNGIELNLYEVIGRLYVENAALRLALQGPSDAASSDIATEEDTPLAD